MKIVIAPDSYKESLSATEVAQAIEKGFREIFPEAQFVSVPVADGGEGTVEAMIAATQGRAVTSIVTGPLGEAVELDGANRWQQFWHITLPQLRPTTFFVVIMLTISGFKVYDQMYMITQGGPGTATMTLVYYIYNVAFVNTPKYGYASAIAMVLFVLVLIVTIIQFRGSKGDN